MVGQATSATIIQSPGGATRRSNVSSQSDEGMSLIVQLGTTVVSKPGSSVTGAPGIFNKNTHVSIEIQCINTVLST